MLMIYCPAETARVATNEFYFRITPYGKPVTSKCKGCLAPVTSRTIGGPDRLIKLSQFRLIEVTVIAKSRRM